MPSRRTSPMKGSRSMARPSLCTPTIPARWPPVAELRKRAEAEPEKSPSQILEERFEDLIRRVVNTGSALDGVEKKVIVELLSRLNQSVQGCDVPLRGYHFVG
jgi:hypothetical protein